ncbi:MAG: MBL fold metallo-hydrolase [Clostridiaceae bacterium]
MGIALKGADQRIIYIDPILSDVVAVRFPSVADKMFRAFPAPLDPAEIDHAALVLCTHDHLDHTDPLTLGPLAQASPQARFVISGWAHPILDEVNIDPERRIVPLANTPLDLDGIRITAIPAAHYDLEYDPQRGYRFFSFLIEWQGITFFHSGDTLPYPGYLETLRKLPKMDVAMIASNGRDALRESFEILGNLMPAEAAWFAKELDIDVLLSGHNDLFEFNTLRAGELADAVRQINPRQKQHTLQPGELYYYIRPQA